MTDFFSWSGLDRALSDRAQSLFILAAALANLIFLNQHIKVALQDFLPELYKGAECKSVMDGIEFKLLSLYLSTFCLGVCSLIIKVFMPEEIKLYQSKVAFVEKFKDTNKDEIYAHFCKHIDRSSVVSSAFKRSIISIVHSTQQMDGMTTQDISNYSKAYYSHYYDLKKSSFILAPAAKLLLAFSIMIFCTQALRTFLAVICIETISFGLRI